MANLIKPKRNPFISTMVSSNHCPKSGNIIKPTNFSLKNSDKKNCAFRHSFYFFVASALIVLAILIPLFLIKISDGNKKSIQERVLITKQSKDFGLDIKFINDDLALIQEVSVGKKQQSPISKPILTNLVYKSKSPKNMVEQVYKIIANTNRKQTQARLLAEKIVIESKRLDYDPIFVAAVMKSESAFNQMAVSYAGAQGLMQIMPATGKYLLNKHKEHFPKAVKLTDPDVNIRLGIKYLIELEKMYQGNRLLTLIAYNWGPGKLDRAIQSKRGVPKQCIQYALRILKDHNLWQI